MTGPSMHPVREPAVAGSFYPADAQACGTLARKFLADANAPVESVHWIGGIVPHAGWICSGAIAAQTVAALAGGGAVDLVVVFGAVHTSLPLELAALDSYEKWQEPGGLCEVRTEIRRRARQQQDLFCVDDRFHRFEHAVEVELPLIQMAWPKAAILPVEVPLFGRAIQVGRAVAKCVIESNLSAVCLASSDLTHYGPSYRFAPAGVGLSGLEWAKQNDRRLLEQIEKFEPEQIVDQVQEQMNACGGGAIAAMMAACRELGATRAKVLRHANSYETLACVAPQPPDNAVGYASVVVG